MKPDYGMPVHPICDLFPLMDANSLAGLAADISANGLLHAIVVHEGQIVDGRNRLLACREAGQEPRFAQWREVYTGAMAVDRWIWSLNVERRHLTPDQIAWAIVQRRGWEERRAAMQRQIEAANRGVEGGRGRKKTLGAEGPQGLSEPTGRTRDVLALESGTSTKRIRQALTVQKLAAQGRVAPELAEQLTDGTVKLHEVINRAAPAPAPAKDGSISADQSIAIEAQKATWEAAEWVRLRRLDALDRIHTGQIPQPKPNVINRIMKTAGASKRKAQQAITVQKADPELLKQVVAGTISLNDAAMQVTQDSTCKPSKRQQIRDAAAKRRMVGALSQIRGACRGLSGLNASAVRRDCSDEETATWAVIARNAAKELRLFSSKLESTKEENQ